MLEEEKAQLLSESRRVSSFDDVNISMRTRSLESSHARNTELQVEVEDEDKET